MSVLVTHVKMVARVLTKLQAMGVTALLVSMEVTARIVSLNSYYFGKKDM